MTSFLGLVGPGVKTLGVDNTTWASHADTRPTILALTGLTDDYTTEGRVLLEDLNPGALTQTLRAHHETLSRLGQAYSQINAPVGQFGLDTLKISTTALASNSAGDATYANLEAELAGFGQQRDLLAGQIQGALVGAEFNGQAINEKAAKDQIARAESLLATVHAAAA